MLVANLFGFYFDRKSTYWIGVNTIYMLSETLDPQILFNNNTMENVTNESEELTLKNETIDNSSGNWSKQLILFSRCYVLPILTMFGLVLNLISAGVLTTKRLQLKRSLAKLFVFLNISDS